MDQTTSPHRCLIHTSNELKIGTGPAKSVQLNLNVPKNLHYYKQVQI